ncbi:lipopolysaccharide assembly protein LapB [Nitrincola sp.]|uniref:lipopolysaccharide assembly protein LapB n=1 Tax=Nitrincola sp. TaxID=1926584 RepID=UPI003A8DEDA0
MSDYVVLIPLLMAAIAAGWLLGRYRRPAHPLQSQPGRDYYHGLNFLIHNKTDEAVERFIRVLEINSDTVPAYLALADLFRKKGEYEKAIELHQTLLARSDLLHEDFLNIQISLAKDYNAVGLLDRAETLLQSVISDNPRDELRHSARRLLAKLYEKQLEWDKALNTALKLPDSKRTAVAHEMAHYACQLADGRLGEQGTDAESRLKQALKLDPTCVRANLMLAEHRMQRHAWRGAIKHLKEVADQDPLMIPETVEMLRLCYTELDNVKAYQSYLEQCLGPHPSTTLIVAKAQLLHASQGDQLAVEYIIDALKKHPSLRGFNYLISLQLQQSDVAVKGSLSTLRELTEQLAQNKPRYRCGQCGYDSKTLYWQCPSCKTWDSSRPVQGLEGE